MAVEHQYICAVLHHDNSHCQLAGSLPGKQDMKFTDLLSKYCSMMILASNINLKSFVPLPYFSVLFQSLCQHIRNYSRRAKTNGMPPIKRNLQKFYNLCALVMFLSNSKHHHYQQNIVKLWSLLFFPNKF